MGQTSSSTATGSYAAAQQPVIPNASGNAPMPHPANVSNAQQAIGFGGTYVVNATGLGQEIGVPHRGGRQAASGNVMAMFLQGLALQSQAAAPAAVPPRAPALPQGAARPIQLAQAAVPQLAMASQQTVPHQAQPMPRPALAVPAPMQPVPPAPRPIVRPLMPLVAQQPPVAPATGCSTTATWLSES